MRKPSPVQILYAAVVGLHIAIAAYITLQGGNWLLMGPVSLLFLLIPPVVERLFRLRLGVPLKICILLMCMMGYSLGTVIRFYDFFPGYDKMLHTFSGVLFSIVGVCLYSRISGDWDRRKSLPIMLAFGFGFSMFVAVLWEIFEYVGFLLTGHDAQNVASTGVGDTMWDLIVCFLGSCLVMLDGWVYARRGRSILMRLVTSFDAANLK